MEWVQNLKQTRNGSIYSETTSSLSTLDDRAVKRRKTTSIPADESPKRCHLEALPAELLQQIFLTSVNGNLIRASPVIALKLSGQTSFYRAAFLLAFFSHDVNKVFDIHRMHYFIPKLELPLSTWDVRSLTRAVLGSRWCTWGRVKSWLSENLKYAITQMLEMGQDVMWRKEMQKFMQGKIDIADLSGTAWWSSDKQQRALQLETKMWDIRLTKDSDTYEDEFELDEETREDYERDPYTAEWRNEVVFQCQFRILGVLTIGDEKMQNYAPDFSDSTAFRYVVRMYMGLDGKELKPLPQRLDFFQLLEERAVQATRNQHWLRETLAIDYFFWPDDQPYKVSPRLYRAAAAADLKLEYVISSKRGCYMSALYVLFEIDPLSLPRTDPALLCWAGWARRRILTYREMLLELSEDVEQERELRRDGILRNCDMHRFRALKLEHKYCYDMDLQILRYMKTGSLTVRVDNGAPSFAETLPWHGEQLDPFVTALEEAERAACFEADPFDVDIFNVDLSSDFDMPWDGTLSEAEVTIIREGPLDFFDEGDYCNVSPRHPMERNEPGDALTSFNSYYRSWNHDGYQKDPVESVWGAPGFGAIEEDEDAWSTEEEEYVAESEDTEGFRDLLVRPALLGKRGELANIHYGEEPRDDPYGVREQDMAIDWVVARPDRRYPIPPVIKDTELAEPFIGPPSWFKASEKPYLEELHQSKRPMKRKA